MPGPSEHPPIPPTSRAAMPSFRDGVHRRVGAGAFGHLLSDGDAARYDDVRPGYPPEVVNLVGAAAAVPGDAAVFKGG